MAPRNGTANPGSPVHISPAASPPLWRDGNEDEAFFPDEAGATLTARKLHENRFKNNGKTKDINRTNPLLEESAIVQELTAADKAKLRDPIKDIKAPFIIFVPATAAAPFKISVLFGVGQEMIRHGLRKFFESFTDRVFVLVSGVEDDWPEAKPVGRAWGVGITNDIIAELLKEAGFAGAAFTVDVLAGYSTGYRGLAGTINNWESAMLDLTGVRTVIFYDALYSGDEPPFGDPTKRPNNTKRALTTIGPLTDDQVRVIVYEVTPGGTPRDSGDTRVPQSWLSSTFGSRYQLINLKPLGTGLLALIYARMFDAAVKDGYFAASELPTALQNLITALPDRGKVGSMSGMVWLHTIALADWATTNAADVAAVQGSLDALHSQVIADPRYQLMGWFPKDVGDVLHDGFIPEFAWEFLCG